MPDGQEAGCSNLTITNDGFTTPSITYESSYIIRRGKQADQESIRLRNSCLKSWDNEEVVYEDIFDSYSMDLEHIQSPT
jgi:hypothetical protein